MQWRGIVVGELCEASGEDRTKSTVLDQGGSHIEANEYSRTASIRRRMTLYGQYSRLAVEVARKLMLVLAVTLALFLLPRLFRVLMAGYIDFQPPPWRKFPAFVFYTAGLLAAPLEWKNRGLGQKDKRSGPFGVDAMLPDRPKRWILSLSLVVAGLIVEYFLG